MSRTTAEIRVADLMTRSVYTLTSTQSLPLAESMMGLLHIRHIPVIDDSRKVVGLVTHRDLLSAKISTLAPLSDDERSSLQLAIPVSRVMITNVWTIASNALAINATRIMREHRLGCLPVVDDGELVGIITEADLLALVTDALALERPPRPTTIEQVMTHTPVTIGPETTIAEARAMLSRFGIHHLPVVEGDKPRTLVTERDLGVAEAIFFRTKDTPAAHAVRLLDNGRVHNVDVETPLQTVLLEMCHDRVDAVLVNDRTGRLVGIFTAVDACRLLAEGVGRRSA